MEYIGWIPCINGHLDFGLMKPGIQGGFTNKSSKDEHAIEINTSLCKNSDSHHRYIILQSKVDWRDSEKFPPDAGKFRVVVTAEVNESHSMDDRCLTGNILIYPVEGEPVDKKQRHQMNVHRLCHSLHECLKMQASECGFQQKFAHLVEITSGRSRVDFLTYFSSSLSFNIHPNGIIRLQYNEKSSDLDSDSLFVIARQAFYYLKYSLHVHKHHIDEQDSLTSITPIYEDNSKSETDAAVRLICQLKRELTSIKRIQNLDSREHPTNNALGIIAYTRSFITSLEDVGMIEQKVAVREQRRFDHLRDSFSAQNAKMSNEKNNLELVKSKSKVWLGFLVLSIWGAINFNLKSDNSLKIEINAYQFMFIISGVFLAVFFVYLAIKRFYLARYNSEAAKSLYDISYWALMLKILVPIALAIGLITLKFNKLLW
jgi:hypothetical protein